VAAGRLGRVAGARRVVAARRAGLLALLAVLGPGLLAGLSDDDPAGITTYSILGARFGYRLLWVLALATAALVVFHELAARMGVATGKGLMALVREHYGHRTAMSVLVTLVVANVGTMCAELAGVGAASEIAGVSRYAAVPLAGLLVSLLVLRGSFHRVEHVLLAVSTVFIAYVIAGVLSHPDWHAAARGVVVPSLPITRDALLVAVATVGTTLAPWGLAFIQSYAVDKHVNRSELRYERIDVAVGAVLTGIIGAFIVVACAATLHANGLDVDQAQDAAKALEPLVGSAATALFATGLLGAALLAAAVLPLSTAYSVSEAFGQEAALDDRFAQARVFYLAFGAVVGLATLLVLVPGAPLVSILYLTQSLNAVLVVPLLVVMRALARDPDLMGDLALSRTGSIVTLLTTVAIAACVVTLGVLELTG
jgi:NRAMP (natural resistance-associated macrophage protein)-like metal ion transporter